MKKGIYAFLLLASLAVFGFWWLGQENEKVKHSAQATEKKQIVASGYVVYDLLRSIGGDKIAVTQLVPPGTEPHHFEPTPGTIIRISEADLLVYVSAELEPWVKEILKGLADVPSLAAGPVYEGEDPHVWISPYGALAMAKEIEKALVTLDPQNKAYYRKNLKKFEKEIEQLHQDFKQGLSACQTKEMVHVGHLAFGALARDYHLNFHALTGTSHQSEHSVKKMAALVKMIKNQKVSAVFTEELLAPDLAQMVSAETGVQILPLYTIQGVSKTDFEQGKTYQDFMRQNLENLQKGLVCQTL
ncbi:metal ABC transporter substrate-binding protein [Candidatus Avelusimicrobium sp.]